MTVRVNSFRTWKSLLKDLKTTQVSLVYLYDIYTCSFLGHVKRTKMLSNMGKMGYQIILRFLRKV